MKHLLESSKQQLMNPLGLARRKLVIILNVTYLVLLPTFLISEKLNTGKFVPETILLYVYGIAFSANLLSLLYNLSFVRKKLRAKYFLKESTLEKFDFISGAASLIPILFMCTINMLGVGNPSNDAILTDFGFALALMFSVVIIFGRRVVIIWALIVIGSLFANVFSRGWNYEYHYLTPNEAVQYRKDLDEKKTYAIKRQAELSTAHLSPPKIKRYFNIWFIFITVCFLMAYFFSGITHDILKIVPIVVNNIEAATEESKTIEIERMLNNQKTTTFLNLAHETKTPLTLINNYIDEYIRKYGANEEMIIIKQNTQRLTNDIVNFFDTERFSKGLSTYDHDQVCDISGILKTKIPLFKCLAQGKKITLNETIEDGLYIKAHPGALERIANNLIENAMKYTNSNGVVEIKLISTGQQLLFSVTDTGVGIPAEFHSKIFEPYFQLGTNRRANDGMGLGLPIVKKITQDINAILALHSDTGKGTTVTVAFPKYVIGEGDHIAIHSVSTESNFSTYNIEIDDVIFDNVKSTILVIEDNPQLLSFLIRNLKQKFNVYHAINANVALNLLDNGATPELIISDVMMEGMDGFQFFETISEEKYGHIPFIFLTAKTTIEDKINGLQLGAVDYIEKPFNIIELASKAESLLANIAKQKRVIINEAFANLQTYHSSINTNALSDTNDTNDTKLKNDNTQEIVGFEERCNKYGLTRREISIIGELANGCPNKIIASNLNIAERTVNKHLENIFKKMNASNRVEVLSKLQPYFL